MQKQKSILSFFQKPSLPENQSVGEKLNGHRNPQVVAAKQQSRIAVAASEPPLTESPMEIRGTDTPPEKVPRQVLSRTNLSVMDDGKPSLFSSIMHKFVKADDRKTASERNQAIDGSSNSTFVSPKEFSHGIGLPEQKFGSQQPGYSAHPNPDPVDKSCIVNINSDDDVLGPETPGVRPLVPRVKRIQEGRSNFEDGMDFSFQNTSKRLKLMEEPKDGKKLGELSGTDYKFEWLHPSQIRDANKRSPGDALYDKKTLYIPPDALKRMSASQRQYWNVKCQYMDIVLFFKVGKFYELYELDAEIGHKELDWKMTFSGVGKCRQVGVSESGIDDAVQKLVARGYKVGRMEQLETSEQAKSRGSNSVVQRKLTHVITPSTTVDTNIGPAAVHLLAIKEGTCALESGSVTYGFAFVDCAALKFWVGTINDDASYAALGALLMQVSPKEVIYEFPGLSKEARKALEKYSLSGSAALQLTPVLPSTKFLDALEVQKLIQAEGYFGGSTSREYALDKVLDSDEALCALGALVGQLSRLMLDEVLHNGDILPYHVYRGCLRMDGQTLMNLEIFSNNIDGSQRGTFLNYLDSCITSSGKRVLRNWICHPLKDVDGINNRLNVVESLKYNSEIVSLLGQHLRKLPDLERLLGRAASMQSSVSLVMPFIGKKILKKRVKMFGCLVKGLRVGINLLMLVQKEDRLFSLLSKVVNVPLLHGHNCLGEFLTQFEAAVDSDFPNYQNHEVTEADAETLSILIELFVEKANQWSQIVHAINVIDVLRSFAITASLSCVSMCRPVILPHSESATGGPILKLNGLWHPFALGETGMPVPNDMHLGGGTHSYHPRTLLLTGPNMGGKSTLLRATCLAVLLAQLGCYVPCELCILSLVDIIFTRLGATDRIMTGESTFLIECTETASVLQNATQDSLVLLDELGRGTSTFDGYAIAYAVFRHLVEKVNCRLLFATHYHPLTKEFACHPRVMSCHMACSFKMKSASSSGVGDELVFLYRLASGASPESYGLQVAVMAGIPKQVIEAASKARGAMKSLVGESFKSSEQRSEFSTLHEEWFKALLTVSSIKEDDFDDDAFDTLFCLWHELKGSYRAE